jgi:hypothetical protein
MDYQIPEDSFLFLDSHHGTYIPQLFIEQIRPECLSGVSDEDIAILKAGHDHEDYWEAWHSVLDHAIVTNVHGGIPHKNARFTLYQDGDLWLVPENAEWVEV